MPTGKTDNHVDVCTRDGGIKACDTHDPGSRNSNDRFSFRGEFGAREEGPSTWGTL